MKKLLSIALAALCAVSILSMSSCSSAANSSSTSKASTASATATSGTLTIGVDDTYPPMEYQDNKTGKDVGFDVDMGTEIAKRLGKNVKFTSITWEGIFSGLKAKKFDCIISSVSLTEAREKEYAMTKAYCANAQMIVVKKDDASVKSQNDLSGKNVGCQINTTANDSATTLMKRGLKFNLTTYDKITDCFTALKTNKISSIIVDEVVGEYYIAKDPADYQAASVKLTNEPVAVCCRKEDTALRDSIQGAIDKMVKDGTMAKFSVKWFGKDLTSNIDEKLKSL
jgi:polar amino acid transport system substrate-binding protein